MSRSRRRSPFKGMCGESEKNDKRKANRRLRYYVRQALRYDVDPLPALREVSDPWIMAKDGKVYVGCHCGRQGYWEWKFGACWSCLFPWRAFGK